PTPLSTLFPYTTLFRSSHRNDVVVQRLQAPLADGVDAAFLDHAGALPVVAAVEGDEDLAAAHAAEGGDGNVGTAGESHPEHINRSEEHTSELQSLRHLV